MLNPRALLPIILLLPQISQAQTPNLLRDEETGIVSCANRPELHRHLVAIAERLHAHQERLARIAARIVPQTSPETSALPYILSTLEFGQIRGEFLSDAHRWRHGLDRMNNSVVLCGYDDRPMSRLYRPETEAVTAEQTRLSIARLWKNVNTFIDALHVIKDQIESITLGETPGVPSASVSRFLGRDTDMNAEAETEDSSSLVGAGGL